MKKVLAFGASNSKNSINKSFAIYVAKKLEDVEVVIADLNDYELPLYGIDREQAEGFPANAERFNELLASVDGIVMSMAEHNGNYTAVFKNLFDWLSRIDRNVWKDKPIFVLGTSPGGRGAANVLRITKEMLPHFAGNLIADLSLPLFNQSFQNGELVGEAKVQELADKIKDFQAAI